MYKYDHFDQSIVDARVAEFRDQVNRRIAGEITEDQFKPLRLMNGLYLQLHAYMLRVAIPYGTLDSRQMRMLAHIARKYGRTPEQAEELARAGEIPGLKIGRGWLFVRADLLAFLAERADRKSVV